jgi:hypothetical protein
MRILPSSKQEWGNLLLLPFKAYAVIFPIWCFIYRSESFRVREAQMFFVGCAFWTFVLCVPVFTLAALIQVLANQRQPAIVSLVFALAIPLSAYFLLPMIVLSK